MAQEKLHDLVIVGGGPAGLSAAVGAESEWLDTLVLEWKGRLGGQAGTSSLIENFPGFPEGISGPALAARIVDQALRFDTEFMAPVQVDGISVTEEGFAVHEDGDSYLAKAALLSCGVTYRRLKAKNLPAFLGRGVHYGSPRMSNSYKGRKAVVIGGANSSGQAAMYLSQFSGCDVQMLVRGNNIEDKMSGYLVDRISASDSIQVHTETEVVAVMGRGKLESVAVKNGTEEREIPADDMFIMIGAEPRTGWLPEAVRRDKLGFILAGASLPEDVRGEFEEENKRQPLPHETSMPGVFVAGDVRNGSNKRVALAVGDGMEVIPELHQYRALTDGIR